jgi:hypothetical protein
MLSTSEVTSSKRSISGSSLNKRPEHEQNVDLNVPTQLRFPNSVESTTSVILKRVSTGFFQLFARRRIPLGARVQVLFRGELVNGEVIYCRNEGEGFSVGVNLSSFGTVRREMRYPVDLPAVLRLPESEEPFKVRIIDTSDSGLGMHVPVEINIGTTVAVEFARGTIVGEIRNCVPLKSYFRAGLAVEEFIRSEHASKNSSSRPVAGSDNPLSAK